MSATAPREKAFLLAVPEQRLLEAIARRLPRAVHPDHLTSLAKLIVLYGEPIPVDDLRALGRRQAARIATERLMARIYELEAELGR